MKNIKFGNLEHLFSYDKLNDFYVYQDVNCSYFNSHEYSDEWHCVIKLLDSEKNNIGFIEISMVFSLIDEITEDCLSIEYYVTNMFLEEQYRTQGIFGSFSSFLHESIANEIQYIIDNSGVTCEYFNFIAEYVTPEGAKIGSKISNLFEEFCFACDFTFSESITY